MFYGVVLLAGFALKIDSALGVAIFGGMNCEK
jgi:hypothetical protein